MKRTHVAKSSDRPSGRRPVKQYAARWLAACALFACVPATVAAQTTYPDPGQRVLTQREQAVLVKGWIQKRFDTLLGTLMQRTGIDMWVMVSREYNDDPVFRSMAPVTT
jgi:hypothetical protein